MGTTSDTAVAGPPTWRLAAAIIASAAALLGTSDEDQPARVYTFEKSGVDGPEVELTAAAPVVPFLVTIQVDSLGPDGADSTQNPSIRVVGEVRSAELEPGADAPFVAARFGVPGAALRELQVLRSFDMSQELVFEGDCQQPGQGAPCVARVLLELARLDEPSAGGSVGVSWSFDLRSFATLPGDGGDVTAEPPWTVEITPQ